MKTYTLMLVVFTTVIGLGTAIAGEAGFVGHTIHVSSASYGNMSFAIKQDGTYADAAGAAGTWTLEGETLCFHASSQDPLCGHVDTTKKPGDEWEDTAWDGNGMAKLSITAGTQ